MSDSRFEHLVSRLLDEEATQGELAELVELLRGNPDGQRVLQGQLEAAEMLAQVEDELRKSSLFLAATQSRLAGDSFVSNVRAAIADGDSVDAKDTLGDMASRRAPRAARWPWAAAAAAVALTSILFLRQSGEREIARITESRGAIQWTGDGGRVVHDLAVGSALSGGTLECLSADSWSTLTFRDGSTVTVSGQSMLTISEMDNKQLHLRVGSMSANVTRQPSGGPMVIHTPTAQLEVLGTRLTVEAEPSSTMVSVNDGRVRVTRLADGRVADVPTDHQVVATVSRLADLDVIPRPVSVDAWQSRLPRDVNYGRWDAESASLQATPLLWRRHETAEPKPLVLYLVSLSVSRGERPPVALRSGGMFRIRGRLAFAADVMIGLTTHQMRGGFAGKHHLVRQAEAFPRDGGVFELDVRLEEFTPNDSEHQPDSPIGLVLFDWWCLTTNVDAGLAIESVELLPRPEAQG